MLKTLEYIEEIVARVAKDLILIHRTYLGRKSPIGDKNPTFNTFQYQSRKYKNQSTLDGMTVTKEDMLVFKCTTSPSNEVDRKLLSTFFGYSDLPQFLRFVDTLHAWCTSAEFSDLYELENGRLIINKTHGKTFAEVKTSVFPDYSSPMLRAKPSSVPDKYYPGVHYKGAILYMGANPIQIGFISEHEITALKCFLKTYNIVVAGNLLLSNALASGNLKKEG